MKTSLKRLFLMALVLVPMFFLASCKPAANPEKAQEALEKKDYIVELYEGELLALSPYEGLEAMLMAYNEDEEAIVIYYFETSKDAKEAWDELEDELKEEVEDEEKKIVVKRSGKMIYAGTKQAIKDAR